MNPYSTYNPSLRDNLEKMLTSNLASLILMLIEFLPVGKNLMLVTDIATAGNKISLIKIVRSVTDCGLKETKDFVEGAGYLVVDDHQARILENIWQFAGGKVATITTKPPF